MLTPDEHLRPFGVVSRMGAWKARGTGCRFASLLGWWSCRGIVTSRLSGGIRQKLSVVPAELDGPDFILFDESYQGLDEDSHLILRSQLLRWCGHGAGILMITHMLHDLDDIDHVIEFHSGEDL